jgi:PEP-CTERM motif
MSLFSRLFATGFLCGTIAVSPSAFADIVSTSGEVQLISPPASAKLGELTSDSTIFGFRERNNVLLAGDLAVDGTGAGTFVGPVGGSVLAGTRVASYLFHSNTASNLGSGTSLNGSVTFGTDILGIIFSRALLNGTDDLLGFPSTIYPSGDPDSGWRELESPGNVAACGLNTNDCVSVSADLHTLNFLWSTGQYIDEMRVVTAVPEPSSLALAVLALLALRHLSPARRP